MLESGRSPTDTKLLCNRTELKEKSATEMRCNKLLQITNYYYCSYYLLANQHQAAGTNIVTGKCSLCGYNSVLFGDHNNSCILLLLLLFVLDVFARTSP